MSFVIEPRSYDDADVTRLVAEIQAHFVDVYGEPDRAVVVADEFAPPQGLMLVGLLDGDAVATGGWRRLPDGAGRTAEVKRMYVRPSARRRGLARTMLAEVERTAAVAGVEHLVLNTGPREQAAIELYGRAGYAPSPAFGYYAEHGDALFYAKTLSVGAGR